MKYRFKASCSKDQLREIRLFVTEVLNKYSLSEIEVNKLVLAVDEICANLIIHSHQCNAKDTIELNIKVEQNEVIFEIFDSGLGFNICNYHEPSLKEIVKEKKKGGVGLMLVKRIVDEIEFKNGKFGNVCRLYKKI